jgi:hypothetical protein
LGIGRGAIGQRTNGNGEIKTVLELVGTGFETYIFNSNCDEYNGDDDDEKDASRHS